MQKGFRLAIQSVGTLSFQVDAASRRVAVTRDGGAEEDNWIRKMNGSATLSETNLLAEILDHATSTIDLAQSAIDEASLSRDFDA